MSISASLQTPIPRASRFMLHVSPAIPAPITGVNGSVG